MSVGNQRVGNTGPRAYSDEIPPNFVLTEVVFGVGCADRIIRGPFANAGATSLREDNRVHGNDVNLENRRYVSVDSGREG